MDVSEFRLSWDKSTAQCYVIDEHRGNPESNVTQVYYWEVNWQVPPFFLNKSSSDSTFTLNKKIDNRHLKILFGFRPRFFCNRDYVCGRRAQFYEDKNLIVVYSKSTEHPTCPPKSKNFRVEDYWYATLQNFSYFSFTLSNIFF